VLQCVAVSDCRIWPHLTQTVFQRIVLCCSVLQCVVVRSFHTIHDSSALAHARTRIHTHVRTHTHTNAHTHTHTSTYTHTRIHTHAHTQRCTYAHTHTRTQEKYAKMIESVRPFSLRTRTRRFIYIHQHTYTH